MTHLHSYIKTTLLLKQLRFCPKQVDLKSLSNQYTALSSGEAEMNGT